MDQSLEKTKTLGEILRLRSQLTPNQIAYTFLENGQRETQPLTYQVLDQRARIVAMTLHNLKSYGERALLLYRPGLDFIVAFCACLYEGVIAIPVPLPDKRSLKRTLPRLHSIIKDSQASLLLTTSEQVDFLTGLLSIDSDSHATSNGDPDADHYREGNGQGNGIGQGINTNNSFGLSVIATDKLQASMQTSMEGLVTETSIDWQERSVLEDNLAYLQYTSGSTATPKGVKITHQNLLANCKSNINLWCYDSTSVSVTWMPYYHDYGLVDGLLQPLYCGIPSFVISPFAFLKNPFCWLRAISHYGATHSASPNFGYNHCIDRIKPEQISQLDLSGWRVASSGAEIVRAETLADFVRVFSPCGFRNSAFFPSYGLAESTLLVTAKRSPAEPTQCVLDAKALEQNQVVEAGAETARVRTVMGCGYPDVVAGVEIVDPVALTRCGDQTVGEIWVTSPSVAQGYWNNPEATKGTFQAYLSDTNEGPYLRTGDLGFLKRGELFVTGRLKDLIIVHGDNYYPEDIEYVVNCSHPLLRRDCCAAFTLETGKVEQLVVLAEVKRQWQNQDLEAVITAIRSAVSDSQGLQTQIIALLKSGNLSKTSSGKIQRRACRDRFLSGDLNYLKVSYIGDFDPSISSGTLGVVPVTSSDTQDSSQINPVIPASFQVSSATDQAESVASDAVGSEIGTEGIEVNQAVSSSVSSQRADQIIDWLRRYGHDRLNSQLMDLRRCIPPYVVLDFGNQGILGLQVPEEYGGRALLNQDFVRVLEQVGAIDLSLGVFVVMNNALGIRPIQRYSQPELRETLLPILAQGRELASFGLTEPGAGSNPRAIAATATPESSSGSKNQWRLNGTKIWSGSAAWSGMINVFVQHLDPRGQAIGISGFVIRQGMSGLRTGPEAVTMGLRGMVQNTTYLENILVNDQHLLGKRGAGMEVAQDAMMFTRLCLAAISLGAMKRCVHLMHRYAQRRHVSTGRLLDNPLTRLRLSEHIAKISAAKALIHTTATLLDGSEAVPEELYTTCKIIVPEMLGQIVDDAMQLLGGRGYMENNPVAQIFRDARGIRIFEGPTETLTMHLGARVVKQGEALQTLLCNQFNAPDLAERLQSVAAAITSQQNTPTAAFHNDAITALRYSHLLIGEITAKLLVLAITRHYFQSNDQLKSTLQGQPAIAWCEESLQQLIDLNLKATPREASLLRVDTLDQLGAQLGSEIGDFEQTGLNQATELDPILRRDISSTRLDSSSNPEPIAGSVASVSPNSVSTRTVRDDTLNNDALQTQLQTSSTPGNSVTVSVAEVEHWLQNWFAQQFNFESNGANSAVDCTTSFVQLGLESVTAATLVADLEDWLDIEIDITLIWDYPTISSLAQHIVGIPEDVQHSLPAEPTEQSSQTNSDDLEFDQLVEEIEQLSNMV